MLIQVDFLVATIVVLAVVSLAAFRHGKSSSSIVIAATLSKRLDETIRDTGCVARRSTMTQVWICDLRAGVVATRCFVVLAVVRGGTESTKRLFQTRPQSLSCSTLVDHGADVVGGAWRDGTLTEGMTSCSTRALHKTWIVCVGLRGGGAHTALGLLHHYGEDELLRDAGNL